MEMWNTTTIYTKYSSPKINIEKEYTIMGVNAIISATGGSLGLFLGLSCYGVAWKLLVKAEVVINSILRPWRKRKARAKSDNVIHC